MIEAALFQVRLAAERVDPSLAPQLALCVSVASNAVESARGNLNAARVNDIAFAVNDLNAVVQELPQTDADLMSPLLATLLTDLAALKEATALDPALLERISGFSIRLRDRMNAIDRQTYVESGSEAPLPHPPTELRREAIPIAQALLAEGFATPALDAFILAPDSLRFHSIRDILDELEVITG
ncbi:MAG: hypothetical protein QOK37_545 [Thermoanaerobaculia bacterium]|nr:hypothetical protein [Thermoanaerobaculia bacterium]